jgi:hypothetical protein
MPQKNQPESDESDDDFDRDDDDEYRYDPLIVNKNKQIP